MPEEERERSAGEERDWRTVRRISRLEAEVRRLQTALKGCQARYGTTASQLRQMAQELEEIRSSQAWRWGLRLRRLRHELIGGSWEQRRAFVGALARRLRGAPPPAPEAPAEEGAFRENLEAFLQAAKAADSEWFYFMFSGSPYIQEHRGHPLFRISRVLRERGVPIFYSYYRWTPAEPIPEPTDPLLFQCPIDKTFALHADIIRRDLGAKKRVYLVGFPHTFCARSIGELSSLGWLVHYHCMDEWYEFHKVGMAVWYDEGAERACTAFSDVVTATAKTLVAKLQGYTETKTVHWSPNALDTRFVRPDMQGRTAPREGPRVIGYFGHLTDRWFDWEALREIARRLSDYRFEIIGHGAPGDPDVPSNVILMGPKNHDEINRIARQWRAALVLRKINRLTEAMDSIKVYEYLALGLPMVCFTMRQIEDYPYVFSAPDLEGFCEQVRRAAHDPIERGVIDEFLARNRWEDRVDQFLRLSEEARENAPPLRGLLHREPAP